MYISNSFTMITFILILFEIKIVEIKFDIYIKNVISGILLNFNTRKKIVNSFYNIETGHSISIQYD